VAEAELSMAQQIIKAGYHALAQKYHPDRGGDANQMRELNAAHEGLKETLAQQPTV
jgi:DnaJ-class molecular chaperone